MKKSTQDTSLIQSQIEELTKRIQSCKKFINSSSIERVTVIFSGVHISISYDEIFVLDKPDSSSVSDLQTFFQHIADKLYSQKLLLENAVGSLELVDEEWKKKFGSGLIIKPDYDDTKLL